MSHVFIIAEAGINHNGSLAEAKKMVDLAKACNVDAIKFQTFSASEVVTQTAPKAEYQLTSFGQTQYDMIAQLELSRAEFVDLKQYCEEVGVLFLSSPFDMGSLEFLIHDLRVPIIKIPSGEITNAPLLYTAAFYDKPVILSTGMCTIEEITLALGILAFGYIEKQHVPSIENFKKAYLLEQGKKIVKEKVTLLHCTTAYPTPFEEVNLKVIDTLSDIFDMNIGYSDHTLGIYASLGAVSHGACVIEKHFTLDKSQQGPDHAASLDPAELKELVKAIRIMSACEGKAIKQPTHSENKNKAICRKSLVASCNIKKGEQFIKENLSFKRPGDGISPIYYWDWLNKVAMKNFEKDEQISEIEA